MGDQHEVGRREFREFAVRWAAGHLANKGATERASFKEVLWHYKIYKTYRAANPTTPITDVWKWCMRTCCPPCASKVPPSPPKASPQVPVARVPAFLVLTKKQKATGNYLKRFPMTTNLLKFVTPSPPVLTKKQKAMVQLRSRT